MHHSLSIGCSGRTVYVINMNIYYHKIWEWERITKQNQKKRIQRTSTWISFFFSPLFFILFLFLLFYFFNSQRLDRLLHLPSYTDSCVWTCLKFSFILKIFSSASFLYLHRYSTEACINFKETFTRKLDWMPKEMCSFKDRLI